MLRFAPIWLAFAILVPVRGDPPQAVAVPDAAAAPVPAAPQNPPVRSILEMQVELHRRGFSCGSIDGAWGTQTEQALRAFQRGAGIADSGVLDGPTQEILRLTAPALKEYTLTGVDLGGLRPVPDTWLGKSQAGSLGYATAIELAGERFHAHPNLLRQLNPTVDWGHVLPGTKIEVPAVESVVVTGTPDRIVITLGSRELEVVDAVSRVIAHFPVSIAKMAEKRPAGDLHVVVVIPDPNYTFDPALFPESPEGKAGQSLTIPPGPNNPVGLAWIGLDLPGYGIHGTPEPENIGRTESHGCFRLANWDAVLLMGLVRTGMTVSVEQ